ncbi:PhoH family protein, partial [gut metagenome]
MLYSKKRIPLFFIGANNANLRMLRALCPKLRIMARDNVVRVIGGEEDMVAFEELFSQLEKRCARFNRLTEEDVLQTVRGVTPSVSEEGVIVYSTGGKPITPRSENQRRLVEAYQHSDMIFAVGPAGSGKTYTAIALAVRAL